jgi:hypothetical protein
VTRCEPLTRDSHTDASGNTLAEWPGGCLYSGCPVVPGTAAIYLTKRLQRFQHLHQIGLANIRTALNDRRRKAGWNFGGKALFEQILIASNAEIGVAKAQFFPQIALTGSGGGAFGRSSAFTSLMSTQLGIWSYGARVSQPIFTGGALRGNLRLAKSENQQALILYRQTIQQAFADVSDALIGYEKLHQVRMRQQDTVSDLEETVRISTLRYKGGTTTYLEVLDGQRSLYSAELTLASARGDEYRSLVQLYKALGGGWQQ